MELLVEAVVLQNDVQRLVPGNLIQHDSQRASYSGVQNDVQSTDFVNQPEEIAQVHIFQVHRDRFASVLSGNIGLTCVRALLSRSGQCRRGAARLLHCLLRSLLDR